MKRRLKPIKCPTCKREGNWLEGAYGPFCSKRCKLVDLGKWFGEEHLISKPLTAEDVEKLEIEPQPDSDDL
jgi:uncharacterized protein